ncbi:MAG TPA: GGDEF domain-containing protein [Gaiellaceae bacterium]|nr:GGDEF domain-containing protein [Gaiellaceae bacterium]
MTTPAAAAVTPADEPKAPRRRRPHFTVTRKSGVYLLGGLLVLAAIPVVATVRILDQNAVGNARARADAVLRLELEAGVRRLGQLGDDASARADDLVRSPAIAQTFIVRDRQAIAQLARRHPGIVFTLDGRTVAGRRPPVALTRTVWLTVNGKRIGSLVGTVALDQRLGPRLLRAAPHDQTDRLLVVRGGAIVGTKQRFTLESDTVDLGGKEYRALFTPIPNGQGSRLLALRPVATIRAGVAPYRRRIRYAALGSFAMLALVSLLFARPILRALSDFRRVASQAATDSLTGLANRRSFDEELALEWRRAERVGDSVALILADIDDFKRINDTYGHQVGDTVLATIGEVLRGHVRQLDFAARYGGEEFAVLLPETDVAGARTLAQRLRRDLAKTRISLPGGRELGVTASFGVAAKGDFERAEELIAAADLALYDAKKRGKNRVASRRSGVFAAA